MDPLIAAISGLGVAITGLGTVLWKTYRSNGHQQSQGIELLKQIKSIMEKDAQERHEGRQENAKQFQQIGETLAFLRGRQGSQS